MATSGLDALLECVMCLERLTPPTTSCPSGHNVCSSCRMKHSVCYKCKLPFSISNNGTLDQIIQKTLFPCIYYELGCKVKQVTSGITLHETKECKYRNVRCFLGSLGQRCNETVLRDGWLEHLQEACRYRKLVQTLQMGEEVNKRITLSQPTGFEQTMYKCGDIYFVETCLWNTEVKSFLVCCHYLGRVPYSRRFIYTVQVDQESIGKAWQFIGHCLPYIATEYDIRKDVRTALLDPMKFRDSSRTISYSFMVDTDLTFFENRNKSQNKLP